MEKKNKRIILVILLLLTIAILVFSIYLFNKKKIKTFKKVVKETELYKDFNEICYNYYCSGFLADKGNLEYDLYNKDLEKVGNFKLKDKLDNILGFGENHVVYKNKDGKYIVYTFHDKKEREIANLHISTNKFIVELKNDKYNLYDNKMKYIDYFHKARTILDRFDLYYYFERHFNDDKIDYFYDENLNNVFEDSKRNAPAFSFGDGRLLAYDKVRKNYYTASNMKQVSKTVQMYDLDKKKFIGNVYNGYQPGYDNETYEYVLMLITRSDDKKKRKCDKYYFDTGKIKPCTENELLQRTKFLTEFDFEINDRNYQVYSMSALYKGQKSILVNNLKDKTCGLYDLENKKYKSIYNHKCDNNKFFNTIDKSNGHFIYTFLFDEKDNKNSFIYDMMDNKILYEEKDSKYNIIFYQDYDSGKKLLVKDLKKNFNKEPNVEILLLDKNNKVIKKFKDSIYYILNDRYKTVSKLKENPYVLRALNLKEGFYDLENDIAYEIKNDNYVMYFDGLKYVVLEKDNYFLLVNPQNNKVLEKIEGEFLGSDSLGIFYKQDGYLKYHSKYDKTYKYKLDKNEKAASYYGNFKNIKLANFFIFDRKKKTLTLKNKYKRKIKDYKGYDLVESKEFGKYIILKLIDIKSEKVKLIRIE